MRCSVLAAIITHEYGKQACAKHRKIHSVLWRKCTIILPAHTIGGCFHLLIVLPCDAIVAAT